MMENVPTTSTLSSVVGETEESAMLPGLPGGGEVQVPAPTFLEGAEVARSRRLLQPGFEGQLSLLEPELELKKKLILAILIILAVFFVGIAAGAVVGIFV